ncbi:hypothetical protein D3C85_1491760 [compost metagenome]
MLAQLRQGHGNDQTNDKGRDIRRRCTETGLLGIERNGREHADSGGDLGNTLHQHGDQADRVTLQAGGRHRVGVIVVHRYLLILLWYEER